MKAPNSCPMCSETEGWTLIDTTKKGFNAKKALIGGILLGGVGLAAGAFGNKKALYVCKKCGFQHEYDGVAEKNIPIQKITKKDGFKETGLDKVWIDVVVKATPICQFCERPQKLFIKYNFNGRNHSLRCCHCLAEFQCEFASGGKIKSKSVIITNCGDTNKNNFKVGPCAAELLIKDTTKIK